MAVQMQARYLSSPVPLYFEQILPAGDGELPPIVLVHGGALTGACYLTTPDGRPGWSPFFAEHGYATAVPDWPGVGRSSHVRPGEVTGELVSRAIGALLEHLGRPAVLLVHSMSGPYGFRVVETHRHLIRALVAVAPGQPGNILPRPRIVREDDNELEIATPASTTVLTKTGTWLQPRTFVTEKLIGASTRFPAHATDALEASVVPIPARLRLERSNVGGTQLRVIRREPFAGLPTLIVTGTHDRDHPREFDAATADWLTGLGADVDHHYLGDYGIEGSGHMLMAEDNSDAIATHITQWLDDRLRATD